MDGRAGPSAREVAEQNGMTNESAARNKKDRLGEGLTELGHANAERGRTLCPTKGPRGLALLDGLKSPKDGAATAARATSGSALG